MAKITFLGAHPLGLNPCGGILKTLMKTKSQRGINPQFGLG